MASAVVEIITTIGSIKRMRQGEEGGRGDKAERVNSENSRGTQTRSKECARARDAFFFFFNVSLYVSGQRPRFISTFIYFELAAHRF